MYFSFQQTPGPHPHLLQHLSLLCQESTHMVPMSPFLFHPGNLTRRPVSFSLLEMKTLKLRLVKQLAQGHTDS